MKARMCAILFTLPLALAAGALETLTLENGRTVTGDVVRASDRAITLKSPSGVQTYALNEFDAASRKLLLETVLTNTLPPPPAVAPPAPEIRAEAEPARAADRFLGGFAGALVVSYVLLLVAFVWFVVQGYRTSVPWGVANLLLYPLAPLAFAFFHTRAGLWPLLCLLAGLALFFGSPLIAAWSAGG